MPAVAPDLRPRGPAELYDAAVHLCARGGTPLPSLALAGAVLPAVSGLALAQRALTGHGYLVHAAIFAGCLMARGIFSGAAALAGEASLEGTPISAGEALARAARRGVSLSAAGGLLVLIEWFLVPATLFIGLAAWSPLFAGPALVARGEAGPWGMGRACRTRLGSEPTFVVRLLHNVAFAVVAVNVASGVAMGLYLSRTLLGLDVTFLEQFASARNPVYLLAVVAVSAVALEPVKAALGLLLLVDARVRSEGLDLKAAVERLAAARAARGLAAALVLALGLGIPAAARAEIDPQTEGDLADLMADTGLDQESKAVEDYQAARELAGPEAAALRRFSDRLREAREAGESTESLAQKLRDGLHEARRAQARRAPQADPRAAAQEILAQPEFEPPPERVKEEPETDQDNLLLRLLRWLFGDRKVEPEQVDPPGIPWAGLGPGVFQLITYLTLGIALGILAFVIIRALVRRQREDAEEEEGAAAGGAGEAKTDLESALAKAPSGWWSEADALAAKGQHRAAMRALYLAVLSALHRRGAIDYDPTRSNWDYVKAFKGGLEELPPFRDLTRRFDFAWYGRLGADASGYDTARTLAGPLVEKGAADA